MAQGAAEGGLDAGGGLAAVGFQEFQPGGGVVEKTGYFHGAALRAAPGAHLLDIPGGEGDAGALAVSPAAGSELYLRHGGDGGQGLAPKAHGAYGLKALLVMELGGGVAEKGHACVLRGHAAAVVADSDKGGSPVLHLHGDVFRPGVYGVFHQLLYNGGGAFHHFAGGYHIRHLGGEYIYNRHWQSSRKL